MDKGMDPNKITFRKMAPSDAKLVKGWLGALPKDEDAFERWICLCDGHPVGLILSQEASKCQKQLQEPLAHWVEGLTLLIDIVVGDEAAMELCPRGFSVSHKAVLLAAPEVQEEKKLEILEKAGFVKVSTFILGQGFFKGKPHYLLKLKV